jgi:hypothetical protein
MYGGRGVGGRSGLGASEREGYIGEAAGPPHEVDAGQVRAVVENVCNAVSVNQVGLLELGEPPGDGRVE